MSTEAAMTNGSTEARPKRKLAKTNATATKKGKQTVRATSKKTRNRKATKASKAGTKKDIVLELLRRKQAATLADIAKVTAWQNHSNAVSSAEPLRRKWGSPSNQKRTSPANGYIGSRSKDRLAIKGRK